MTDWVNNLIGKPWAPGARGPEAFDCWGLLCWVYEHHFGVVLDPSCAYDAKNVLSACRFASAEEASGTWALSRTPAHGDAVAMSQNKRINHVGVYLNIDGGMVLHSRDKSGVIIQNRFKLASAGINNVLFYRHGDIDTNR